MCDRALTIARGGRFWLNCSPMNGALPLEILEVEVSDYIQRKKA